VTTGANGASVEIVVVDDSPRINLVRGDLYSPEILTRDEAAAILEASYGNPGVARDCDGDCWLCLLDEAVSEFR
jgi:CRISPR/Cas system-associated exonuclease Cas4 (RecB family)